MRNFHLFSPFLSENSPLSRVDSEELDEICMLFATKGLRRTIAPIFHETMHIPKTSYSRRRTRRERAAPHREQISKTPIEKGQFLFCPCSLCTSWPGLRAEAKENAARIKSNFSLHTYSHLRDILFTWNYHSLFSRRCGFVRTIFSSDSICNHKMFASFMRADRMTHDTHLRLLTHSENWPASALAKCISIWAHGNPDAAKGIIAPISWKWWIPTAGHARGATLVKHCRSRVIN